MRLATTLAGMVAIVLFGTAGPSLLTAMRSYLGRAK